MMRNEILGAGMRNSLAVFVVGRSLSDGKDGVLRSESFPPGGVGLLFVVAGPCVKILEYRYFTAQGTR